MNFARFTIAYWCVLLAALMPLACAWMAKKSGFDNRNPRTWWGQQTGWRARANAAQANCFEALPFFIGAVLIAHQLGAVQVRLDILAFVYITLRVIYVVMYIADLPTIRSIVWVLALLVNIGILFVGYR